MPGLGRILIYVGVAIALLGVCLLLADKLHIPLGRLPGDFSWHGKNSSFYFPLATCILVSVVLTLIFYIIGHFRR
jgi:hypothetical protein